MIDQCKTIFRIARIYIKRFLGYGIRVSYSQNGEDVALASLMQTSGGGMYIDVGAYHPTLYSNTYALYQKGWCGIVIEPNAASRQLFKWVRPRDQFIHAGIAKNPGTQTYYRFSDGAYNTFDKKTRDALSHRPIIQKGEEVIPMRTLAEVVHTHTVTHIDVLNIDVVGLDLEVLESHDWNVPPLFIIIEDHTFRPDNVKENMIVQFLSAKGYTIKAYIGFSLIFAYQKDIHEGIKDHDTLSI
jgi:FkbM family methyltransferase